MADIVQRYGYRIGRDRFIRCPFHKEKTASMMIYKDSYYCFGCGATGDIFKFVMDMDGLSFKDAFISLGGTYDHAQTKNEARHRVRDLKIAEQKRQKELAILEEKKQEMQRLSDEINLFVAAKRYLEPLSDEWCYACRKLPILFDKWEQLREEVKQNVTSKN